MLFWLYKSNPFLQSSEGPALSASCSTNNSSTQFWYLRCSKYKIFMFHFCLSCFVCTFLSPGAMVKNHIQIHSLPTPGTKSMDSILGSTGPLLFFLGNFCSHKNFEPRFHGPVQTTYLQRNDNEEILSCRVMEEWCVKKKPWNLTRPKKNECVNCLPRVWLNCWWTNKIPAHAPHAKMYFGCFG